jgi:hypothetical protein
MKDRLSLRDQFAMACVASIGTGSYGANQLKRMVQNSYLVADLMLEEREKPKVDLEEAQKKELEEESVLESRLTSHEGTMAEMIHKLRRHQQSIDVIERYNKRRRLLGR